MIAFSAFGCGQVGASYITMVPTGSIAGPFVPWCASYGPRAGSFLQFVLAYPCTDRVWRYACDLCDLSLLKMIIVIPAAKPACVFICRCSIDANRLSQFADYRHSAS